MSFEKRIVDIEPAVNDLKNRTLSKLPCDFSRLVYLASVRDYAGQYSHDGLAFHFSEKVASKALAACHLEIFEQLVDCTLEELVGELHDYTCSTRESPEEIVKAWEHLESYRVTIPSDCDVLAADFFSSNVRVALAILQNRQKVMPQNQPSA